MTSDILAKRAEVVLLNNEKVVSSADLLAIDTEVVEIVAAPGAGKVIILVTAAAQYIPGPGPVGYITGGANLLLGIGENPNNAGSPNLPFVLGTANVGMGIDDALGLFFSGGSLGTEGSVLEDSYVDQPLTLGTGGNPLTTGDGSLRITAAYYELTLS